MHKFLAQLWKKPSEGLGDLYKQRLVEWRQEPVVKRLERPTRLDRAHALGYKAKQGVIVVRVRVPRGGRKRPKPAGGRVPKKAGRFFSLDKSRQQQAEERLSRKYPNMEVLNSYWVAEDGNHKWFEVILVDRDHPGIKRDKNLKFVARSKGRANRGLTSIGKKSRGL